MPTRPRLTRLALTSAIAGSALAVVPATSSLANADGCTFVDRGALMCQQLRGDKTLVDHSTVSLNPTVDKAALLGICGVQAQWTFTRGGKPDDETPKQSTGCSFGFAERTWRPKTRFDDGSKFCAALRANITDNKFRTPQCHKIKG